MFKGAESKGTYFVYDAVHLHMLFLDGVYLEREGLPACDMDKKRERRD